MGVSQIKEVHIHILLAQQEGNTFEIRRIIIDMVEQILRSYGDERPGMQKSVRIQEMDT